MMPKTPWEWVKLALAVLVLAYIAIFLFVAGVDGDSMEPRYKTGDRIIFNKYAKPYVGASVYITIPNKEPMIKMVVGMKSGSEYCGKIIHADEIAVEGCNPNSIRIGIIKRRYVRAVAVGSLCCFPKTQSTAERADGPKPAAPAEFKPAGPQAPHDEVINDRKVRVLRSDANVSTNAGISVAGDQTLAYKTGLYVYDRGTGGCYRITRVSLSDEPIHTIIEVEPPFSSAVIGQKMYLLDHKIPPGPALDAGTLQPSGPIGPSCK